MLNLDELASRSSNAVRVRAIIEGWDLQMLKDQAADRSGRFFLSEVLQPASDAAAVWFINEELTRRGIAPRFRGFPRLRAVSYRKGKRWIDITPPPIADSLVMARAIDLQWLSAQRAGEGNVAVERLHKEGVGGMTARRAMASQESRANLAARFDLTEEEQLQLSAIVSKDVSVRRGHALNRIRRWHKRIEDHRGDLYRLPEADMATRKAWAIALEHAMLVKAEPSGEDLCRWMARITGRTYTRQAANKARRVLLDLRSRDAM